jgi:hypothetical protein
MSNTIQLGAIETDVTGYGPDYYRRKQEPTEPYYVENLNFDDAVQKEYPGRDVEVEQYLVNQAHQRGQDSKRPFQKTLRALDWGKGDEKIRTEYWDPKGVNRGPNQEAAHYDYMGYYQKHQDTPIEPTIRMFQDPKKAPYTHEFSHHLYNFQDKPADPRRRVNIPITSDEQLDRDNGNPPSYMDKWRSEPSEIQADASKAKRDYTHNEIGERLGMLGYDDFDPEEHWGLDKDEYQDLIRRQHNTYYGVEPFDKNHSAVKEGKPIPDPIIDDMFESWMQRDDKGWGESYRNNPQEFPVEMFKEALKLGKNDQKPAGLFTGRGPQNA